MDATGIERLLADVEEATRALKSAYDRLIEGLPDAHPANGYATHARESVCSDGWVQRMRSMQAEHVRPKGPAIALESEGWSRSQRTRHEAEFVRATATQVVVLDRGRERRFRRKDGAEVCKSVMVTATRWFVPADELARVDDLAKAATPGMQKPKKKTG